ncbi:MAG: asparagine--tRNA ligase [Candidatus Marsarchaeota archaeon]|nr:asparagine--tRNA ligase [Candidatus Marsarchaeota archaeon]
MASYSYASEMPLKQGKTVSVRGWIYRKRESGGIIFIVVRDRTGIIQTSVKKDSVDTASWKAAQDATIESSIELSGSVKADQRAPTGYEIEAKNFKCINVSEPFPITEYQSTELLLDKRHLWLRSMKMTNIMKMRSYVFRYLREFHDKKGFYEITPPLITRAAGETGADMFPVDYFGQQAYLTESSQLYAEAMIFSLEKVYSFAPSYRAEKSRTVKHLAEYWHLEMEAAHYNLDKLMKFEEQMVSYVAQSILKKNADILDQLNVDKAALEKIRPPFKRLTYEQSLEVLNQKGKNMKWGDDLGVEEERLLTEDEEKPVFVMYWPREMKAFYQPINPKDERTTMSADLQAPRGHGEIIGASERIWRYDELMQRFHEFEKAKGIKFNMENYEWYIDLRRYGSVPHSGFGLGTERLIKWMLNLDHIRDAIPFPRMVNRLFP